MTRSGTVRSRARHRGEGWLIDPPSDSGVVRSRAHDRGEGRLVDPPPTCAHCDAVLPNRYRKFCDLHRLEARRARQRESNRKNYARMVQDRAAYNARKAAEKRRRKYGHHSGEARVA